MNRSAAVVLILFSVFSDTSAHTRSESYSHWQLSESSITATITIPLREVMLLYEDGDANTPPKELFKDHVLSSTVVRSGDNICNAARSDILQSASGFVRVETHFECESSAPDTIQYRVLFNIAPAHVHYAKLYSQGAQLGETLITDSKDTWDLSAVGSHQTSSVLAFMKTGVEHIAGGIDHIAFLLGLLLIAGSVGRSVIAVTGFTLGHSISLAAAVFGLVHAEGRLVEAFIGYTVMLVAVEYFLIRRRQVTVYAIACLLLAWITGAAAVQTGILETRALFAYAGFGLFAACYLLAARKLRSIDHQALRRTSFLLFIATACFGIVHGFGFAGFLIETGTLGTSLFAPLLGFNLGVEIGQLILVAIALGAGALMKNRIPRLLPSIVAASLCGIGVFWFLSRTLSS